VSSAGGVVGAEEEAEETEETLLDRMLLVMSAVLNGLVAKTVKA